MAARGATLDDLRRVDGKAELVGGEIVRMTPAGGLHSYASRRIAESLGAYERQAAYGCAFVDNAGFVVDLPHRRSFSPDASFYLGNVSQTLLVGAPVFAVEIRSEEDYGPVSERRMAAKRADYFAAGTLVVWDVDLKGDVVVRVFRVAEPHAPLVFTRGDLAHAEPAVPGWSMAVDDLFRPSSRLP